MKVCLAQINTTPGDFDGNLAKILKGMRAAAEADCELLVFPELTIPGYLSQDLIYNPAFVDKNLSVLDEIVTFSESLSNRLHTIVGYIDRNTGVGKPFTNMAGVIAAGELKHRYQKQLLPFYDVFDELRYFEPGSEICTFDLNGRMVGVAICEDLWNDKDADDYNYENNPYEHYRAAKVDLVVSLNSSPFVHNKTAARLAHIAPPTENGPDVVYVNQIGGQDELVFDGQSFVVRNNRLVYLSESLFEDTFDVVDLAASTQRDLAIDDFLSQRQLLLKDLLVLGLKDYVEKSGFQQIVLASSGGVDSAVVCMLACEAVGSENVHAIRLPSVFSSDHARSDAIALHENLGCWDYEIPVDHEPMVEALKAGFDVHQSEDNLVYRRLRGDTYAGVADENIQARLRDLYVMHFSNAFGAMPLSTGNKTEAGCGYYTHFDMNFSYAPIKDLYKFQVMDLARTDSRIPDNIWKKPPSAELALGQTDEESLMPYAVLDPIVMAYVEEYVTSFSGFTKWVNSLPADAAITSDASFLRQWLTTDFAESEYLRIVSLIGRMEYKRRQTCPGTKVSKVAFGIGRRIPIVEKWS